MRKWRRVAALFMIVSLLFMVAIDCGKKKQDVVDKAAEEATSDKEQSTAEEFIDNATGNRALKDGEAMKSSLKQSADKHNEQLDQLMKDDQKETE